MKLVLFGLYTWWIPQIVLSAVMDGRQPLKPVYIIGTSAARLALPLYLYGCPANLLRIPPAPRMLAALVASVAAQVIMVVVGDNPHEKNCTNCTNCTNSGQYRWQACVMLRHVKPSKRV